MNCQQVVNRLEALADTKKVSIKERKFGIRAENSLRFTPVKNTRSKAVMRKLNMTDTMENVMHPSVSTDADLQEHVLFKITKTEWRNAC